MNLKKEIKEYIEKLTGKNFPNIGKLSIKELEDIKQLAIDSELFWTNGGSINYQSKNENEIVLPHTIKIY